MFDFLDMANNYEERVVDNTKINEAEIDTCAVTDSDQPFETGVAHPRYNDGKWVIVEMYNRKKEAISGHKKWVKIFSAKKLPKQLTDVSTSTLKKLIDSISK